MITLLQRVPEADLSSDTSSENILKSVPEKTPGQVTLRIGGFAALNAFDMELGEVVVARNIGYAEPTPKEEAMGMLKIATTADIQATMADKHEGKSYEYTLEADEAEFIQNALANVAANRKTLTGHGEPLANYEWVSALETPGYGVYGNQSKVA